MGRFSFILDSMITALVLSVLVPVFILVGLPHVVLRHEGESKKNMPWLYVACALYIISWWLPSPSIEGRDTSFVTHFVGGGLFTGLVWYYLKQSLKWNAHWLIEAVSLFALVSVLGVANELLEIVLYLFGRMPHGISDTSWDLLANTLGALGFYIVYAILRSKKGLS